METERLKIGRALGVCLGHADALQDALDDLGQAFLRSGLSRTVEPRSVVAGPICLQVHAVAKRHGRTSFPGPAGALGEEVSAMSVIDRLNRLEQLGWIPLADEWLELRRIRNEFTHGYPDNSALHLVRLRKARVGGPEDGGNPGNLREKQAECQA